MVKSLPANVGDARNAAIMLGWGRVPGLSITNSQSSPKLMLIESVMPSSHLIQCMKVKSESEVTQLYPTPSDPMDCSLPGSSVHEIF